MTPLSTRMVEAAALSRYERMRKIYVRWPAWADADQRTKERWCENARLDLTAALAVAEEEGALGHEMRLQQPWRIRRMVEAVYRVFARRETPDA